MCSRYGVWHVRPDWPDAGWGKRPSGWVGRLLVGRDTASPAASGRETPPFNLKAVLRPVADPASACEAMRCCSISMH